MVRSRDFERKKCSEVEMSREKCLEIEISREKSPIEIPRGKCSEVIEK